MSVGPTYAGIMNGASEFPSALPSRASSGASNVSAVGSSVEAHTAKTPSETPSVASRLPVSSHLPSASSYTTVTHGSVWTPAHPGSAAMLAFKAAGGASAHTTAFAMGRPRERFPQQWSRR